MVTSNDNAKHQLKRTAGAGGAQFSDGKVNVALSGDQATVQGTDVPLSNCKLKNTL